MKLIVANGPPRSGKDTVINIIESNIKFSGRQVIRLSYKWVLCEEVGKRYGLNPQSVWEINDDTDIKDDPLALFGGKSVRQALIYESEEVIKKDYGPTGVAIKAYENIRAAHGEIPMDAVFLNPDGGFDTEVTAFMDHFPISRQDVLILRMVREGKTFAGDSRSYLKDFDIVVDNNGGVKELSEFILPIAQTFINKTECKVVPTGVPL